MRTPPSSGSITTKSPSFNPYLSRNTFGIRICPLGPTLILSSTKADRVEPWFYKLKPCYYFDTVRRSQGDSGLSGTTWSVVLAELWRDVGNRYLIEDPGGSDSGSTSTDNVIHLILSATEVAGIHASTLILSRVGISLLRFHPHRSQCRSIG